MLPLNLAARGRVRCRCCASARTRMTSRIGCGGTILEILAKRSDVILPIGSC